MTNPACTDQQAHESNMEQGSFRLLEGIHALRIGAPFRSPRVPAEWLPPAGRAGERVRPNVDVKVRVAAKVAKTPKLSKLDIFAEYLAEGFEPEEIAQIMGYWNGRQGNAMLQRIRSQLGWQAV